MKVSRESTTSRYAACVGRLEAHQHDAKSNADCSSDLLKASKTCRPLAVYTAA